MSPAIGVGPVTIATEERRVISELPRSSSEIFDIYNWQGRLSFEGQNLIDVGSRAEQDIFNRELQDFGSFFRSFDNVFDTIGGARTTSHEIRRQNEERLFGMFDCVVDAFLRNVPSDYNVVRDGPSRFRPLSLGANRR